MKRSFSLLAATLLPAVLGLTQTVGAYTGLPDFNDDIMNQAQGISHSLGLQNIGHITANAFKVENGPGAAYPDTPQHLTPYQVQGLLYRMISIDQANKPSSINKDEMQRVYTGLGQIDILYVDPISTQRWDSLLKIMGDTAAAEYPKNHDWNTTIDDMFTAAIKTFKDPHTDYWNPQAASSFKDQLSGTEVGIGISVLPDPRGVKIGVVYPHSGAQAAGLKAGDIIITAAGQSLAGMNPEGTTKLLRGQDNTQVSVTVLRNGQTVGPITVTRHPVQIPQMLGKMERGTKIGYVYLAQFGDDSVAKQVIAKVQSLRASGAKAIILDLRGDGGGYVNTAMAIASEFLKNGQPIVTFKHQGMVAQKFITDGNGRFVNLPLVVLVDKYSASASEITAAAMQDLRHGYTIVGTHSYGKGSEQMVIPQSEDSMLHITVNHNYRPNGQSIDAKHDATDGHEIYGTGGVEPNVVVPVTDKQEEQILENINDEMIGLPPANQVQDPALLKALEILNQTYI